MNLILFSAGLLGLVLLLGSIPPSISDSEVKPFLNPNAVSHMSETAIEILDPENPFSPPGSSKIFLDMVKIARDSEGKYKAENFTSQAFISQNVTFDKPIPEGWKPNQIEKISSKVADDASKNDRIKVNIILKDTPSLPLNFHEFSPSEKSLKNTERRAEIDNMQQSLLDLLEQNGATDVKPNNVINTIDANIPSSLLEELSQRNDIFTIRESILDLPGFPSVDESRMYEGIEAFWTDDIKGSGKLIAFIDTGVDRTHPDLDDIDNDPGTTDPKISNSHYVSIIQSVDPFDCWPGGHGTVVAGILSGTGELNPFLKGFVPQASLMSVKIYDTNCETVNQDFVDAVQYILDYNDDPSTTQPVEVINASYQSCITPDGSDALSLIVDQAYDNGIAFIVGSGNDPPCNIVASPGSAHKVLSVGAIDQVDLTKSATSLGGPTTDGRIKPEVVAVNDITGLVPSGGYSSDDLRRGTSFTAPQVAASFLALDELFERDLSISLQPGQGYAILLSSANGTASSSNNLRMDNNIGAGMINIHKNIEFLSSFITLNHQNTLTVPFTLPSGTERFSAAIWWPESFSQTHNDIDLELHKDSVPNLIAVSQSIDSVAERIVILNPDPGDYFLRINAFNITAPDTNQQIFYSYVAETFDPCLAPSIGEWIISINCELSSSQTPPDNLTITNNGSLTVPSDLTLDVDFENNNIVIESGSKVIVKKGGRIN